MSIHIIPYSSTLKIKYHITNDNSTVVVQIREFESRKIRQQTITCGTSMQQQDIEQESWIDFKKGKNLHHVMKFYKY